MCRSRSSHSGQLGEQARDRSRDRAAGGLELERDHASSSGRAEELRVDPDGDEPVVALEALGRGARGLLGGREQRVHADPQPVAAGAAGG